MEAVNSRITIKLLIDTRSNKVLFCEAGKDFVDFLFSLLTLPLGSVIKLLSPPTMIGSIGKLYQSVENLNETYFSTNGVKSPLLQPEVSIFDGASSLLLGTKATVKRSQQYDSSSDEPENGGKRVGGFVKGVMTYMITDDLEVTPMSAISSITLINRFSLKKDVQLEEKVAVVCMKEGLALLKASLDSAHVLSDVFCSSAKNSVAKPFTA